MRPLSLRRRPQASVYVLRFIDPNQEPLRLDADNARVTSNHIVFYRYEDEQEIFVAGFYLSDVEAVVDLARIQAFPAGDEDLFEATEET